MTKTQSMAERLKDGLGSGEPVGTLKTQKKEHPVRKQKKVKQPQTAKEMAAVAQVSLVAPDIEHVSAAPPPVPANAEPVKTPTPKPAEALAPVAQPQKGPSLLDQIRSAGAKLGGSGVVEAISMASTILTDAKAVATFVEAVNTADALAIQKLSFDRLADDARQEWYSKSLPEMEAQLKVWATSGDTVAEQVTATLAIFRQSQVDIIGPLWQLVVEIVRPAGEVRSYHDLSQLIHSLKDKGLVETFSHDPSRPRKTAVVLGDARRRVEYLPAMERGRVIPMAEAGWPFVKQAEAKAEQWAEGRRERFADMKAQATPDFTYKDAKTGGEGKVFLQTGNSAGALVHIRNRSVRIMRTIGMMPVRPSGPVSLDAEKDIWPRDAEVIFHAFQMWKKK